MIFFSLTIQGLTKGYPQTLLHTFVEETMFRRERRDVPIKDAAALIPGPVPFGAGFRVSGARRR